MCRVCLVIRLPLQVFHAKLRRLIREIKDVGIFATGSRGYSWKPAAMIDVVEFQKRGLPHAHILVILHERDKPRTVADIDTIVKAEAPPAVIRTAGGEEVANPLRGIVLRHMVHGPCGPGFPKCPCMRDGKCSKGYPKRFCDATNMDRNGYPEYRWFW